MWINLSCLDRILCFAGCCGYTTVISCLDVSVEKSLFIRVVSDKFLYLQGVLVRI